MRRIGWALIGLVLALAGGVQAQDCTANLLAKKAGWVADAADTAATSGIAVPKTGDVTITVTQADTQCVATDRDGMDGSAALTIPAGDYTVLARASGKKGGGFTVGGVVLGRAKGKPLWSEVPLSGSTWVVSNSGGSGLQLRVLPLVAALPEE